MTHESATVKGLSDYVMARKSGLSRWDTTDLGDGAKILKKPAQRFIDTQPFIIWMARFCGP